MTDQSACCESCLSRTAHVIVASYAKANRLETAEAFLVQLLRGGCASAAIERLLGRIQAQRGRLSAALSSLERTPGGEGMDAPTRRLIAEIQLRQAAKAVDANDFMAATRAVTQAAELDGALEPAREALAYLRDWQAAACVSVGDMDGAARLWETSLQDRPTDPRLIRQLAIAYYRRATRLESEFLVSLWGEDEETIAYYRRATRLESELLAGHLIDQEEIVKAWHLAIAYWASVLRSRAFWEDFRQERSRTANLQLTDEDIGRARESVENRLFDRFRDAASDNEAQGQTDDAKRLTDLAFAWRFELATAGLMSDYAQEFRIEGWPTGFAAGQLMIGCLLASRTGKSLAVRFLANVRSFHDPTGQRLQRYVSATGRYHYLLDERRYDQVIAELESAGNWPEAAGLLGDAYIGQGRDFAEARRWAQALTAIERAAASGSSIQEHRDIVADCGVEGAKAILANDGDALDSALSILQRARTLFGNHSNVDANLAATYQRKAGRDNYAERFDEAMQSIRLALRYAPNDADIKRSARVILGNQALAVQEAKGDTGRVIAILQEATTYEYDADMGRLLTELLYQDSVAAARAGNRERAVLLMVDSDRYDPDLKEAPTAARAKHRLSIILFNSALDLGKERRWQEALALALEAKYYEDDEPTCMLIAAMFESLDRIDEAVTVLRGGMQRYPQSTDVKEAVWRILHNRGVAYGNKSMWDQSVNDLRAALAILYNANTAQNLAIALLNRAVTKVQRGDRLGGRKDAEEAVRFDPNNRNARQFLASL